MKNFSHEIKVGGTALITILIFIWLFNFLKGKDFLKRTAIYYSIYDKVGGLAESSPVEVNGYKVGVVRSVDFMIRKAGNSWLYSQLIRILSSLKIRLQK